MHSSWLGLCLPHPCMWGRDARRLQSCFGRVTPALFEAVRSRVSWQGGLSSRGSTGTAVMPAGPPRQADGTASALRCSSGHGGVSTACSSVPSPGRRTGRCRIYNACGHPCPPLSPIQLPPASVLRADRPTGWGFARASSFSFFLSFSPFSWKSVELGQDDLSSVPSRWKQVPGCGQVEGALSRQRLGMASRKAAPGSAKRCSLST